jgi:hypothetical protein
MRCLLNSKAIAQRLGCSIPHVRALWDAGALPFIELPALSDRRMRRTDLDVLESWILENTNNAGDAGVLQRKAS